MLHLYLFSPMLKILIFKSTEVMELEQSIIMHLLYHTLYLQQA